MNRLLLLAALLLPLVATADRRELYGTLTLGPAFLVVTDPAAGDSTTTRPALSAELVGYYGLTNSLHVGASLRFLGTKDARFPSLTVQQPDGSTPSGSLYLDTWGLGAAALAAYRLDTGFNLAPVARVEVGLAYTRYSNLALIPESLAYALPLPSLSDLAFITRASLALEYRLGDRFVASAGVGIRHAIGSLTTWTLDIPLTFGVIW